MNVIERLERLDRVTAPPGFEERVLAELAVRRRDRPRVLRARAFRLALSGAGAGLLAAFVILNVFVFERGPGTPSRLSSGQVSGGDILPIVESIDYGRETRPGLNDPRTVFILENVSDASGVRIRY